MAILVQKFGGTSVGNLECIGRVADQIIRTRDRGDQVVVVVSARAGDTDRLEAMAHQISENPSKREMDVLLSSGEQVTVALLAMALEQRGCPAKSYLGFQVMIQTNESHTEARITQINTHKLLNDLNQGMVPVVAGFQGCNADLELTTLGRGGSDMTAVALAAALNAKECQIFTDVEGVYTADPKILKDAYKLDEVTFEEMLEMSSLGAKVLQSRSVECAGLYKVPLRVLSTFVEGSGTLITFDQPVEKGGIISGVAVQRDEAKIALQHLPQNSDFLAHIFELIAQAQIGIDLIVQSQPYGGLFDLSFTVRRRDFKTTLGLVKSYFSKFSKKDLSKVVVLGDDKIAKLSLIGVGMRSHVGIASKMFRVLADQGVEVQLVSTSEIKVSVVIDEEQIDQAVDALHRSFISEQKLKEA